MERGNLSNVKGTGAGIFECQIDFDQGYRVYFGKNGDVLIILLGAGPKNGQQRDIAAARRVWQEYRRRKRRDT